MEYSSKMLTTLHQSILTTLGERITNIATYATYPKIRTAIKAPAIFIELASLEPGNNPGTGQLAVISLFEARVVYGNCEDAPLKVRELAAEVAKIINCQSFGQNITPARIRSIHPDGFTPELDAYEVWMVEWEHEMDLGDSIWDGDGVVPSEIYLGYDPETGLGNEHKYQLTQ